MNEISDTTVHNRTTAVVQADLVRYRSSNMAVDFLAEAIARHLAEEGLLIMDPLPDEDEIVGQIAESIAQTGKPPGWDTMFPEAIGIVFAWECPVCGVPVPGGNRGEFVACENGHTFKAGGE